MYRIHFELIVIDKINI